MPRKRIQAINWWWMIPLLLLLTGLAAPLLDMDGLWYDEIFSLRNAGGAQYGPLSPFGIWQQIYNNEPNQAFGYPYLLALWGRLLGWSEFAGRVLSLFFGLLTLAMLYRIGADYLTRRVGLYAAVVLGFAAAFVQYVHELRVFTMAAFLTAWLLWGYLRLIQAASLRKLTRIGFVMAAAGLLYSHYFAAAIILLGLGLYHLIFAPKNHNWWRLVPLGLLVGLLFLPEVPALLRGLNNFSPDDVRIPALNAPQVLHALLVYIGNGRLWMTGALLLLGLAVLRKAGTGRTLILITIFAISAALGLNALLGILEPQRMRYTIVLWVPLALWVALGADVLLRFLLSLLTGHEQERRLVIIILLLPLLWIAFGLRVIQVDELVQPLKGETIIRWRNLTQVMQAQGSPRDLFAFYAGDAQRAYGINFSFQHVTHDLPFPSLITSTVFDRESASNRDWARQRIAEAQRIWYGVDRQIPLNDLHHDFVALLEDEFVHCGRPVQQADSNLDLYARSEAFCYSGSAVLGFGADAVLLRDFEIEQGAQTLTLHLGLQIDAQFPAQNYSVAAHVVMATDPVPYAQADTGLPISHIAPLSLNVPIESLAAGDYEIRLLIYNWQTGERLSSGTNNRPVLAEVAVQ